MSHKADFVQEQEGAIEPLIFRPMLIPEAAGDAVQLIGRCERGRTAWGFWGVLTIVTAVLGIFAKMGVTRYVGYRDALLALGVITVGVILVRVGRWTSLDEVVLGRLDLVSREFQVRLGYQDKIRASLRLDDISEIVFGMTQYPFVQTRVRVHAFSLMVRGADDELTVVVVATPDKAELYEVAKVLSKFCDAPIKSVGDGIK
jgi:hypothetical protein